MTLSSPVARQVRCVTGLGSRWRDLASIRDEPDRQSQSSLLRLVRPIYWKGVESVDSSVLAPLPAEGPYPDDGRRKGG